MFVGINIVMTVSLGMINGFTGQFSIGHGGFMAVGAYASVFLTTIIFQMAGSSVPGQSLLGYAIFFPAVLIGGLCAALTGFLIGLPTLRVKGDYLAIVTMAFSEVIRTIIRVSEPLGGPRGVSGIPSMTNMAIVMVFTVLSVWLMRNFLASTYGRASRATRDSEIAAEIMGVNTTQQKTLVFTTAAFFAGCCGGLYAHILQFIHPDNFTFMKSLEYLIYLYIGGSSSISGAMTGAVVFTAIPELFRSFQIWRMVIYALLLIVIMLFRPNGIIGDREFSFIKKNNT
ncbi:branched-chain amino acid ABC transporter permease [Candidatus Poribacteria bacterium]|nr:branched-chain amino acid ABC transporter permease [Candidatus Poribacteria bacterium]